MKLQLMIASYKKVSKKLYSVLVKEKGRERRKKKNVFIQSKLVILTQILVSILIIWLKLLFILNFFTKYKQKKNTKKGSNGTCVGHVQRKFRKFIH